MPSLCWAGAARSGRRRMAAEAHRRLARLADAEPLGDHLAARVAQHRIGPAVRAGGGRRVLPEHDLVLADDGAVALAAAVAGGAAAAGDAHIGGAAAGLGRRLGVDRAQQQQESEQAEDGQRANSQHEFAAAPHLPSMPPAFGSAKNLPLNLWTETAFPCNPQTPSKRVEGPACKPLMTAETIPIKAVSAKGARDLLAAESDRTPPTSSG